jgi:hypothetical protein
LVLGLSLNSHAATIEHFDYTAGPSALAGENGGSDWGGSWANASTTGGGGWTVQSPGLEHPSLTGETGNTAYSLGNGSRFNRTLDTTYSSGTVYVSLLMQVDDPNHSNVPYSAFELADGSNGDGDRVFSLGLLRNDDGSGNDGYAQRIQSSAGGGTLSTAALSSGFSTDVNLFVLVFDLDNDRLETFVNPDNTTDLTGSGEVSAGLFSGFQFDRVGLANFAGGPARIDEIRVDTTAPTLFVPEPTSLALGLMGLTLIAARRRR